MNGKGSSPRPIPDRETFERNWDAIFGRPPKPAQPPAEPKGEPIPFAGWVDSEGGEI